MNKIELYQQALQLVTQDHKIPISSLRALVPGIPESTFRQGIVWPLRQWLLTNGHGNWSESKGFLFLHSAESTLRQEKSANAADLRRLRRRIARLNSVDPRQLSGARREELERRIDLAERLLDARNREVRTPITPRSRAIDVDPRLDTVEKI